MNTGRAVMFWYRCHGADSDGQQLKAGLIKGQQAGTESGITSQGIKQVLLILRQLVNALRIFFQLRIFKTGQ